MTRAGRQIKKDCLCRALSEFGLIRGDIVAPYISIMENNIELTGGATDNIPPHFIMRLLVNKGGACYSKVDNSWYEFMSVGIPDRFGNPQRIRIRKEDSYYFDQRIIDLKQYPEFVIFPANSYYYPLANKVCEITEAIITVEGNLSQNLANLREMTMFAIRNDKYASQLQLLDERRRAGQTYGILRLDKETPDYTDIQTEIGMFPFSAQTESRITELQELRDKLIEERLQLIGVTSVGEKQERRVTNEINLIENGSYAFLDLLIDSVNETAKRYNVDIKARRGHECGVDSLPEEKEESRQGANESATEGSEEEKQNA